ncbi:MAG: DUF1559 domain-containing protein, partial [Fuerstiella sp.]
MTSILRFRQPIEMLAAICFRAGIMVLLATFPGGAWPSAIQADEPATHSVIYSHLDASSTVVGWVDISQIDVAEMAAFMKEVQRREPGNLSEVTPVQQALIARGVTRMYWVGDLAGMISGPRATIIPAKKPEAVALIVQAAVAAPDDRIAVVNGVILVGSKKQVAALQNQTGKPDAALIAQLDRNADPHGLVVLTPLHALLPVISILPQLTDNDSTLLAETSEALTKVTSVTLSGQLPPSRATLRIDTKSSAAAKKVTGVANTLVKKTLRGNAATFKFTTDGSGVILQTESLTDSLAALQRGPGAGRPQAFNSLKNIALAMHNFHDVHGHFPPQSLVNDTGKRLLTWRVLILPWIDAAPLYQEFHLDEPWDSEHNRKLISRMPAIYRSKTAAGQSQVDKGKTCFLAPLTAKSVFGRTGPGVAMRNITDGTSNTLMVVEAGSELAVTWTKPEDLRID